MSSAFGRTRAVRTARAALLALSTTVAAAALAPVPAVAQTTPPAGQVDVAPNWRTEPRIGAVLNVGPTGYAHDPDIWDGDGPIEWTGYATGESTPLTSTHDRGLPHRFGTGSDTVALPEPLSESVTLKDMATGRSTRVEVPAYDINYGTFGSSVLVAQSAEVEGGGHKVVGWYLLRVEDGTVTRVPVTGWPEGTDPGTAKTAGGDARSAVVKFAAPGGERWNADRFGVIDLATGALRWRAAGTWDTAALDGDRFAWREGREIRVVNRADINAAPRSTTVPEDLNADEFTLVGDWIVLPENDDSGAPGTGAIGRALVALSADGAQRRVLLDNVQRDTAQFPDSGAFAIGGRNAEDWNAYRVLPAADGSPELRKLMRVEPVPVEVDAVAAGRGTVFAAEAGGASGAGFYSRTLTPAGVPTASGKPEFLGREANSQYSCGYRTCDGLVATGDGRVVAAVDYGREVVARGTGGKVTRVPTGVSAATVLDAYGRYAAVTSGGRMRGAPETTGSLYVVDFDTAKVVLTKPKAAASVWGTTLYSASAVPGEITVTDLATGKDTGTLKTGRSCVPVDIQTSGPWLSWSCGSFRNGGALNRITGGTVALPDGEGLLGDGYFVQTDSWPYLRVTSFPAGVPASRTFSLPLMWRGGALVIRASYTVDRFGGGITYVDGGNRMHTLPPETPASALGAAAQEAPAVADLSGNGTWQARWSPSKPVASWSLSLVRKATGATVRTYTGGEAGATIQQVWNGKDAAGKYVPGGEYGWTLTARPADGQGADLKLSGSVRVSGGVEARRDHVGRDGFGDLVTLDAAGALAFHGGDGKGGLTGAKVSGAGWPTTSTVVPFGDMNGDRCNDVLVRNSTGTLRLYQPACGAAVPASMGSKWLGTGFGAYDVLTSAGDVTGDGRADLLGREAATGDLYLFAQDAGAVFKPRVKVFAGWKTYKQVIGAGDLNGDGRGDLLAVDSANTLWRFDGAGNGTFKARVQVNGVGWASGRVQFIGIGDISGDGRADVVSRNAAGELLRNNGDGKGGLLATVKIATGFGGYRSVS
ncbi:FG-GAP-like repeat-containing protein [Streptomyces sp. NPDC089799]|uniref:FG-GAP-like repeat-containing protein n=1 Tax=Streptomyces sp. NPDC089799 TaxID=3155066 RepID=UPI003435933E